MAFIVSSYLPEESLKTYAWAFWHIRSSSLTLRIAFVALGTATIVPRISRTLWTCTLRTFRMLRRWHYLPAYPTLALLLWGFRQHNYALGDSAHLIQIVTFSSLVSGYHITYDEPWELYVHCMGYRLLHRLGLDVADVYALLSVAAGLAFFVISLGLSRRLGRGMGGKLLVMGMLWSCGWVQLFFGYVENYTLVSVGMALYLMLALDVVDGRRGLLLPALVLSGSFCLHVLAGWWFPTLVYLWYLHGRRKGWRRASLEALIGASVPVAVTLTYFPAIGYPLKYLKGTHLAHMKFMFLLDPSYRYYRYPIWDIRHIGDVLNELILVALPGLLALVASASSDKRGIDGRKFWFLVLCTVLLQTFTFTWNPDLGPLRDWDLFSVEALGYVPLGGYLLSRVSDRNFMRRVGMATSSISCLWLASWVGYNSVTDVKVDDWKDWAYVVLGDRAFREGRLLDALHIYQEAIKIDPRNARAWEGLGRSYLRMGELKKAREALKEAEQLSRYGPHRPLDGVHRERSAESDPEAY